VIRKATEADLDSILGVLKYYNFKELMPINNSVIDADFGEFLSVRNSVCEIDLVRAFVIAENNEIVGFSHYTSLDDEVAKTTLMVVNPKYRGRGFGKALQLARMKEAYGAGFKKLITGTDNSASKKWYEKHFNYKVVGTEPVKHQLHFIRTSDKIIWEIHYGFPKEKTLTIMECDLTKYFKGKQ